MKKEVKRHLYDKEGNYTLFVEGSKEWDEAIKRGMTPQITDVLVETGDLNVGDTGVPLMFDDHLIYKFRKTAVIEVVGTFDNGDLYVQNEGDPSDRWRIPEETFESTYELVEEEEERADKHIKEETEVVLSDQTDKELKAIAKEMKIPGYGSMKRETLITKIMEV